MAVAQGLWSWTAEIQWVGVAVWVLGAVLGVEAVMVMVQLARPMPAVTVPQVTPPIEGEPPEASREPLEMPSLVQSASRSVFTVPAPVGGGDGQPPPKSRSSETVKQLAARLSLIGVVSGEPPQAIIEDPSSGKSYLVSVGQAVVEGAVLKEVQERRAILELDGETFELSL